MDTSAGPAMIWLLPGALALLLGHTVVNVLLLPRPSGAPDTVDVPVAVLVPARDEASRVRATVRSLLDQRDVPRLEVVVLDDGSTDGTADAVRAEAAGDARLRLLTGTALPEGWLGKPYACHQLAAACPGADVLAFVDADVVLHPTALAAAIHLTGGLDLVSAYPRLEARTVAERLIQPLLPWSFLTFLPLAAMRRSRRPSLAAAGGQFLLVTRAGYDRVGGHAAVRDAVLDDVALARAVKRAGGRIGLADFSQLASCRMYPSWPALRDGYAKSLWAGVSPWAAALLLLLYAVPVPLLAVAPLPALVAYGLGVAGRVVTGRATAARIWPDALAHPVSIGLLAYLLVRSRRQHRRGSLRWKGRAVP
jgi:Glycosyltransferase like family 2